ncbi:putative sodium-coupled neutral amino acid transporter 10 [Zerene cesonia]|uniref:putative sodium-coupled neutral amino acid transporter 10 n=1 Tax=Zerene cesonia TaxID=33412 RepID=UPI0018E53A05|nr:putative sodium-coupled neutral amino acid transporter 10 [Zerene cesonia]
MGTTGQSITLANSIIGVGILAMPFCFQQCGVLLATLILLCMGLVSRLCCYFLLKSAIITRRRNYEFLAFHVFGSPGKMAVEVGIIGFLMGTCIAYFVVVGDLGPQIISKMFNINQSDILRTSIMVIVSLVCVLPLGLLRNVDSLSNVSAATIAFYFCLVMKVITEAGSQMLATDAHNKIEMWKPSGLLQCVPIFSMALFCQTQLFEIFESMPSLSLEKMNVVTKNAINICAAVYFTLGLFGYIAFGSQEISGNILMSLSPTMASDVIKLGFVMSVAFSFPLIIFPCRASLYSFLYRKVHPSHHDHIINHSIPESTFRCITVAIIAVSLFISLLLPNIELVLGLVGSTIGVLVCVVFPAACFINVTFKNTNERILAKFILVLGLIILVLGTYANLQAAENTRDKYDDKYITQERIDKIVEDFFEKMEKAEQLKPVINKPKKDVNNDMGGGSVALPPNPIPPESRSNERKLAPIETQENKKDIIPDDKEKINKESEEQAQNIEEKLNEVKLANGYNIQKKKEEKSKGEIKINQEKIDMMKSNQEKIDMIKHQQLMETIKQHGQEQKELIKEQKEILDELRKTKDEIEKNKKEVDNAEAKKIAVESIQKIANMAIQSLTGVTDTPVEQINGDKKSEPLDKIFDNAVNEIAKKAAETLNVIKKTEDVKEKPEPDNKVESVDRKNNEPVLMKKIESTNNIENVVNEKQINIKEPDANIVNNNKIEKKDKDTVLDKSNPQSNIPQNVASEIKAGPIVESLQLNGQQNKINLAKLSKDDKNEIEAVGKAKHIHTADEPQSYKQGEDTQIQPKPKLDKTVGNVPLAIALSESSKIKQEHIEKYKEKPNENIKSIVESTKQNGADTENKVEMKEKIENSLLRQKREVVDCTEKTTLKPEDKQICENLIDKPEIKKDTVEILPKVDLNDILSKSLPMNIIHIRSLKSYEENDKI